MRSDVDTKISANWNFFFFFLISKDDIYTKGYSMHEEHRANAENTRRRKQRKNKIENQHINYKEKES